MDEIDTQKTDVDEIKRELTRDWKRQNRAKIRDYLQSVKSLRGCANCGEPRSYCLVFHHKKGVVKKFDLAHMRDCAVSKIVAEAKKCIILCSNCHLALHEAERLAKMRQTA